MLSSFEHIQICTEVLIEQVSIHQPNVAITDINMPKMDGIIADKAITAAHSTIGLAIYAAKHKLIK